MVIKIGKYFPCIVLLHVNVQPQQTKTLKMRAKTVWWIKYEKWGFFCNTLFLLFRSIIHFLSNIKSIGIMFTFTSFYKTVLRGESINLVLFLFDMVKTQLLEPTVVNYTSSKSMLCMCIGYILHLSNSQTHAKLGSWLYFCMVTRRTSLTQILPEGAVVGFWYLACSSQLPKE